MTRLSAPGRFRLSAHLGYLFAELPLSARFEAAANAGFRAIEIPDPYGFSVLEFRSICERHDLEVAQIALSNGSSGTALKGLAALPGREAEFERALMTSIAFAKAVNCRLIHPMSGLRLPLDEKLQWDVYLSNLARACSAAASEGLCVIIEPISAGGGTPNYFMNSFRLASTAIDQVGSPNLKLSLDTYHATAMDLSLSSFIARNSAWIGHVQLADWPHRNEPGSGQINFDDILTALSLGGYQGYIGLEYVPSEKGAARFNWTRAFQAYFEEPR